MRWVTLFLRCWELQFTCMLVAKCWPDKSSHSRIELEKKDRMSALPYKPWLEYFLPHFWIPFLCFQGFFSENTVLRYGYYWRAVCNQLSRLWWRTYSKLKGVNKTHSGIMKNLRRTLWMLPMRLIGVGGSENLWGTINNTRSYDFVFILDKSGGGGANPPPPLTLPWFRWSFRLPRRPKAIWLTIVVVVLHLFLRTCRTFTLV